MAFNLQAIVNSVTYDLNNGSPFKLEGLTGGGVAAARRLSERGPLQHGDTDLGVRLQPRTITLSLNFVGASASALDTARDTLNTIFKPVGETAVNYPVQLRVTRDDGGVRQLDCYTSGPADIPLIPANRPGNLHRAVVQLRAADPLWYDPTQKTATAQSSSLWWLGLNTISTANVLVHTADISSPVSIDNFADITAGSPWAVAFRLPPRTLSSSNEYAYYIDGLAGGEPFGLYEQSAGYNQYIWMTEGPYFANQTIVSAVSSANYFQTFDGTTTKQYRNNTLLQTTPRGTVGFDGDAGENYWGGDSAGAKGWGETIAYAAIYNVGLSDLQRQSLSANMTAGSVPVVGSVIYAGNFLEFPVIRIYGVISDPVVTNAVTGEKLDFTGVTIGSGVYYEIDLRYGYKTIKNNGGVNKISDLTSDSDLGTFHIAPSPYAVGGVNAFQITGTATNASSAVIYYYNRYTSF